MITKAFFYTSTVLVALYLFTDAPLARGGETSSASFETCKSLDYVGHQDGEFENFQTQANDLAEANYGNQVSACGGDRKRTVNLYDPAGELNEEYSFFTGQKEIRID